MKDVKINKGHNLLYKQLSKQKNKLTSKYMHILICEVLKI